MDLGSNWEFESQKRKTNKVKKKKTPLSRERDSLLPASLVFLFFCFPKIFYAWSSYHFWSGHEISNRAESSGSKRNSWFRQRWWWWWLRKQLKRFFFLFSYLKTKKNASPKKQISFYRLLGNRYFPLPSGKNVGTQQKKKTAHIILFCKVARPQRTIIINLPGMTQFYQHCCAQFLQVSSPDFGDFY